MIKSRFVPRVAVLTVVVAFTACTQSATGPMDAPGDDTENKQFYPGDYSEATIIGNSLPGDWRPFSEASLWNTPIPADASTHPDSDVLMDTMSREASHLRLARSFSVPIWVVQSDNIPLVKTQSARPFDTWDQDFDGTSDVGAPVLASMWPEGTGDGHIAIVDPFKNLSWEMSRYTGVSGGFINCTTFNIWDVTQSGVGDGDEGFRHKARGGRGSGFPLLAGLIRPEEVAVGEIRHALVFITPKNRQDLYLPPAARTDGDHAGSEYPIEGMRLQLDPTLSDADFDSWGLTREGKVVARALQTYGMFNGDEGGAWALQAQLLDPDPDVNRARWDELFPGFFDTITNIPASEFRVLDTGETVTGGSQSTVVSPLILPLGGGFLGSQTVTISTPTAGATITYTTDGTTPDESSTPYTGPFEINSPLTIKARAFKPGMSGSHVTRAPFWEGS